MNPLKSYLSQMSLIRRSAAGVKETSYYGTLANLFNEVGATLKPKVRCVINLANKGAGIPDGGLFTPDQFQRSSNDLIAGQLPSRGAMEVKGTDESVDIIKDTEQVGKYLQKYGHVVVTNYRDFLLVALDENGRPKALERYCLAESEAEFWNKADHAHSISDLEEQRFVDYLSRVMRFNAPVSKPEDVAWFLASYARDARARVEAADVTALESIREALEESLGIKFEGEKGEHFFRSTLVQTLFYGVFSAWVLWHKRKPNTNDRFHWKTAEWELRVPMIAALFEQVSNPTVLRKLNIVEVLDWAENVLNRVVWQEFSQQFSEEHAVQYFYEPFLKAFDPELRKQLGVWYTPEEIVRYMVERVDHVLREELNLPDGLADESVYVLDPACGTGAYLVEVLRRINRTLIEKGDDAVRGQKLKRALMTRVFGFEILPAPFVVSHLQIGLLLEELDTGFSSDKHERAGVYLTNSLTGWEDHPKSKLPFPELEEEREQADRIKKNTQILVVIGNPPYNGYAGVAVGEERELTDAYRTTVTAPEPQGQGLNELYVRFFRMAERRIVEMSKKGIICFISNSSWLEGRSHPGMRERFLDVFDQIWIDNLNGDKYKTGKTTPDGKPDPSVFSTKWNREGIQVGTAISLLLRKPEHSSSITVAYREFWGKDKLEQIAHVADNNDLTPYSTFQPKLPHGFALIPLAADEAYFTWPLMTELFPISFPGVTTGRDDFVVSTERNELIQRLKIYFDKEVSQEELKSVLPSVSRNSSRFDAISTRSYLIKRGVQLENILRYTYRPFDLRWLYWESETKLLDEKRTEYYSQLIDGNYFLFTTGRTRKSTFEPALCVRGLNDYNCLDSGARGFPLYLKDNSSLGFEDNSQIANLSEGAINYLASISALPKDLFFHSLSILHSAEYRTANLDSLRQNFPSIPLPANADDLIFSGELGSRVSALLDTEKPVDNVTVGAVMPELRTLGVATHTEGRQFADDDFRVTAGWGSAGKGGITMPGKGRAEPRDYTDSEREAMGETGPSLLGKKTFDIYINNSAYWRNVPERVWDYHIGGYQVIKKWLSYREFALLGRPLKLEEVEEVTNMIRRIAALLLMEPELNANYQKIKANTFDWQSLKQETQPLKEAGD